MTLCFDESHIIFIDRIIISSEFFIINWLRGFYYVCKQVH